MIEITFRYLTGLKREIFRNARLCGSWDDQGLLADTWMESPMTAVIGEDGCHGFVATKMFDEGEEGKNFRWGVRLDAPSGINIWGIPTEVLDMHSSERYREFELSSAPDRNRQDFYFTYARRLGARKYFASPTAVPDLRFSVWAPNAKSVEVVFGLKSHGYISNDGQGTDATRPAIPMKRHRNGIWQTDVLSHFDDFDGLPYMYRIVNAQDQVVFRTDLFSRKQIGHGGLDPQGSHFAGSPDSLDGSKSCSVVVTLETIAQNFDEMDGPRVSEAEFWADEFTPAFPIPNHVEDLIIYELHVNALGFGKDRPGNLADAMELLPSLRDLGVNAIELLPMSEYSGDFGWGYGDSHYFTVESSAGGRDQYKHFVRACHRLGIAVIQDVCYNHYDSNADRAQWQYDSSDPQDNIFYWYEGQPSDYRVADGGYVDNGSSGYAPRYWEETVRHLFVSSAAAFLEEFHIDGIRVDLTQAIHRDNRLHADGRELSNANLFGQKMLREWSRTLRMIQPNVMLIAEDHTGWDAVTNLPETGGLGFDATWYAHFYHSLIGDADASNGQPRLLKQAGYGNDDPLDMAGFAGTLYSTRYNKVVFHESHDEAGNGGNTERTMVTAVNGAPLLGSTRQVAESRSRVAFGLAMMSAGTPMFFMGEEIAAQKPYRYNDFLSHREDLLGERHGNGAKMFRFYQDLIRFSRRHRAIRSRDIDILHAHNDNRVLAFVRLDGIENLLIVASFRNTPFEDGYIIQTEPHRLPDGLWREVFNSDAALYGGNNFGNFGADIPSHQGRIEILLPASGFVVFQKH